MSCSRLDWHIREAVNHYKREHILQNQKHTGVLWTARLVKVTYSKIATFQLKIVFKDLNDNLKLICYLHILYFELCVISQALITKSFTSTTFTMQPKQENKEEQMNDTVWIDSRYYINKKEIVGETWPLPVVTGGASLGPKGAMAPPSN
jgi:hypothetical protein